MSTTYASLSTLLLNPSDSLPYHLSLLPSFFRILAFLCILPVLLLAAVDIVGWAFFKVLYRPLGYASTYVPSPFDRLEEKKPPEMTLMMNLGG